MSLKNKIVLLVKKLPCGRRLHLVMLSCYKAIVTPLRCRRLQQYGLKILGELDEILRCNNIEYYVAYGTLLGLIREGGFITYDDDMDLLVNAQNVKEVKRIVEMMLKQGFKFKHVIVAQDKILYYTFEKYGVSVDFFCFYSTNEGDGMYVYGSYESLEMHYKKSNQSGWRRIKYPKILGGKRIECDGVHFVIPENSAQILEAFYGERWRMPDESWRCQDNRYECMPGFAECVCDVDDL